MNDNNDGLTADPKVADLRERFSRATSTLDTTPIKTKGPEDDSPPNVNYVIEARSKEGVTTCYVKTGYLYVSSSFIAVCRQGGIIVLLIPSEDLISVEEMDEDEVA